MTTSSPLLQTLLQMTGSTSGLAESKATRKKLPAGTSGTDTSPLAKLFSTIDIDGDGKVTKAELSSFFDSPASRSDLLQVQEQNQTPSVSDIFKSADTDGDGSLSFAEFKADFAAHAPSGANAPGGSEAKKHFSRFDTNKDGVVSQDELAAAFGSKTQTSSSTSSSSSASPDLLGMLMQAISAYASTANSSSATSDAGALSALVKAA